MLGSVQSQGIDSWLAAAAGKSDAGVTGLEVVECANGDEDALVKLEFPDIAKGVGGEESR
jgi:hypothetical protein